MLEPPMPLQGVRIAEVCQAVADYHHVFVDELVGDARHRWILWIRYQAYLLAYETGKSSTAIGRVMRRDHTTILWGIRQARKKMAEGGHDGFARQVEELRKEIREKVNQRKRFGREGME